MGILCCKETQSENENILAPEEKEVAFASYASSNDKMLQKAEKTMRVRKGVNVIKEGNN